MDIRRIFAALLLLAVCGAWPSPRVTIGLQIERTSYDLLDSIGVAIVAQNPSHDVVTLSFPAPQENVVEISDRNGAPVWTSSAPAQPHGVAFPAHRRGFTPGATPVVVVEWNELASGGWSPPAGRYVVHARLLPNGAQPTATATIVLAPPLPPSAVAALHIGQVVTLSGTLDSARTTLSDANGSARLTRRIVAAAPGVPVVVRGYPAEARDGTRTFTVTRWAPLGPPSTQ